MNGKKSLPVYQIDGEAFVRLADVVAVYPDPGLRAAVRDFIAYYTKGGGCSNCGGLPHTSTCFVGRFIQTLNPLKQSTETSVGTDAPALVELGEALKNGSGESPEQTMDMKKG